MCLSNEYIFFRYRLHVCTTCIKKYQILRKGRGRRRVRYLLSPETREMWMWKQRCSATIFFHSINPTRDGDAIQKEAFRRKFQCFRFHEKQFDQAGIFKNDLVVFLYSSGYENFSTDFKVNIVLFFSKMIFSNIGKSYFSDKKTILT